jgi:hypothetical protein
MATKAAKVKKLIAYHGDPKLKAKALRVMRGHRKADRLAKGNYWEDGKGCAVGCMIHSLDPNGNPSDHGRYETILGVPRVLARLEDLFFERLENGKSQAWPERFLEAIEPGADLSGVWPRFALAILADEKHGVINFAKRDDAKKAIGGVIVLYRRMVAGKTIAQEEWVKARAAASAAAYAADADAAAAAYAYAYASTYAASADASAAASAYAASAYAAYAASADADADADAAASGAASAYAAYAASSSAADAARDLHLEWMADTLISLVSSAADHPGDAADNDEMMMALDDETIEL